IEPKDDKWMRIDAGYDWIPGYFDQLSEIPDPAKSAELVESVAGVAGGEAMVDSPKSSSPKNYEATGGPLGHNAMDAHHSMSTNVQYWQGDAAEEFRANFCADLPGIVRNQTTLAKILCTTAAGNQRLTHAARKDTRQLGRKAKAALDAYEPGATENVAQLLNVTAAVFTMAAGATVAAIPIAGTFTVLAGISALAANAVPAAGEKKKVPLSADTVEGIVKNITDAVDELIGQFHDGEDKLVDILDKDIAFVSENKNGFVARRPWPLADAGPGPNPDFRPPDDST
ncbi:MAG: hypothetical protein ACRD0P_14740, partial [Stackebrandtia sp.]